MTNRKSAEISDEELLESVLRIVQHHRTEFYKAQNKTDYSDVINSELKQMLRRGDETNLDEN